MLAMQQFDAYIRLMHEPDTCLNSSSFNKLSQHQQEMALPGLYTGKTSKTRVYTEP